MKRLIIIVIVFSILISCLSSIASAKTSMITLDIFPVKTPTNISTQTIGGTGDASGCRGGAATKPPLFVKVNGEDAMVYGGTWSKNVSLSEGVNVIKVDASIGICSISKIVNITLNTTPVSTISASSITESTNVITKGVSYKYYDNASDLGKIDDVSGSDEMVTTEIVNSPPEIDIVRVISAVLFLLGIILIIVYLIWKRRGKNYVK